MSMQLHDLLTPIGGAPMTVIWRNWARKAIVTVDTDDPKSWPELHDWEEVESLVAGGMWSHMEGSPPSYPLEQDIPAHHRHKRDESWAIVAPLVRDPSIFIARSRGRLISSTAKLHDVSVPTVKKKLLAVFHGGMDPNALIPGWANIGNKGQARPAVDGAPKRGRGVIEGKHSGVNVTSDIRAMFRTYADLYKDDRRYDLRQTYEECMRDCFSEVVEILDGDHPKHIPLKAYEESGLPRYEQFVYWVRKDITEIEALRKKIGERPWALRHRPVLGNSTNEAWGPCARFQIDATIIDVYIRSKRNRNRVVKRATLYVVIDVFSRMIVGFSLSLCPPSWVNAMGALANCVTDKVAYCAKYGITITADEWPCHHLPAIIEGDRGEMEKSGVTGIVKGFGVTVENAAAWRADWKGIVESRFRLLQAQFRPYVPGYVDADFGERGTRDYRLDAKLDLDDLTRVVIHQIIAHNNDTAIGNYPMHPGMIEDCVPAVPREIWNWGIARLGGLPRQQDEATVKFALMHRREAVVRREGIYHQGAFYTCPKAIEENWFERARTRGRFKVWISFDDRHTENIYVHDAKSAKGFQVATLTSGSSHRAGVSFWELFDTLRQENVITDRQRVLGIMGRAGHDAATEAICNAADEAMKEVDLGTPRSQITGINDATRFDRELDRVENAAEYHASLLPNASPTEAEDGTSTALSPAASSGIGERASVGDGQTTAGSSSGNTDHDDLDSNYARPSLRARRSRKEMTDA